ncbi:50S ribosomal protein L3 [Candidatus Micrarchaeota archaeon]|nr:50S ribosomal protein L3 [Candidatus Micrarchaeota archaeon]
MSAKSKPRSGSLGFSPRKRARRIFPSVRTVREGVGVLAFAGYKAGMTTVMATDNHQHSPSYGLQVAMPATVIECPPLQVFGARAYNADHRACGDLLAEKLDKDLARTISLPKKYDFAKAMQSFQEAVASAIDLRLLVHTRPREIGLKKTPECFELPFGGKNAQEKWSSAKELIGKTIAASGILKEGEFIDVTAITKGKGTQGPVKRFGIKIQIRKNKGHRRFPGAIGGWTPSRVLWTVPQMGQMGFQRRTEYNKRVLKVGTAVDAASITPKGGFTNYGRVDSDFVLVSGSTPGPNKRLVFMRHNTRPARETPAPSIVSVNG